MITEQRTNKFIDEEFDYSRDSVPLRNEVQEPSYSFNPKSKSETGDKLETDLLVDILRELSAVTGNSRMKSDVEQTNVKNTGKASEIVDKNMYCSPNGTWISTTFRKIFKCEILPNHKNVIKTKILNWKGRHQMHQSASKPLSVDICAGCKSGGHIINNKVGLFVIQVMSEDGEYALQYTGQCISCSSQNQRLEGYWTKTPLITSCFRNGTSEPITFKDTMIPKTLLKNKKKKQKTTTTTTTTTTTPEPGADYDYFWN